MHNKELSKTAKTLIRLVVAVGIALFFTPFASAQTLDLGQKEYLSGETVTISWTGPAGENFDKDWVGIYKQGEANNQNFIQWKYTNGARTGSVSFTIIPEGTYEARYFKNDTYSRVAQSTTFKVVSSSTNSASSYRIGVNKNALSKGESFNVSWSGPTGVSYAKDWVGIYRSGESNNKNVIASKQTQGQQVGSLEFRVNSAGTYVARYFKNDSFTKVAESGTFTVRDETNNTTSNLQTDQRRYNRNQPIRVSWNNSAGQSNHKDWVGIYRQGENNNESWVVWKYTGGHRSGSLDFVLQESGHYIARYFKNDRYDRVGQSASFEITGTRSSTGPGSTSPGPGRTDGPGSVSRPGANTGTLVTVDTSSLTSFSNPGGTATFTIVVTNNGSSTARNVRVVESFPDEFTFTDTGSSQKTFSIGDLASGEIETVTYSVNVAPDAPTGIYENTTALSGDNIASTRTNTRIEVRGTQVLGATLLPATGFTDSNLLKILLLAAGVLFWIGAFLINTHRKYEEDVQLGNAKFYD